MASSLLERYNKQYEQQLKRAKKVRSANKGEDPLTPYSEALANKDAVEVSFDMADDKGNLSTTDSNKIKLVLSAEDIAKYNSFYAPNMKYRLIGLTITCKISRIDEENRTVYLEYANSGKDVKGSLMKEIFKEINAGRHPTLYGDVIAVNNERVTVNILHRNILGILRVKEWSPIYTRNLTQEVKIGDTIQFQVIGQAPRRKNKDIAFEISRKKIAPNPWSNLDKIEVDSIILVKCVDKPADKSYFWGRSERTPGIDIMCNYNYNLDIMVGVTYKCRVVAFEPKDKMFKVTPFEVVPKGIATSDNINFIRRDGGSNGRK